MSDPLKQELMFLISKQTSKKRLKLIIETLQLFECQKKLKQGNIECQKKKQ